MGDGLPSVDLGTGRTAKSVSAGSSHTCAVLDDGNLKCWGSGTSGQLGDGNAIIRGDEPGEMGDNLPVVDLGTDRSARAVTAGAGQTLIHTCAVLDNNSVKCWGSADVGQLGYGDTTRRGDDLGEMGDNLPAIDLGAGSFANAVAAGDEHTCAIVSNVFVRCWGRGNSGRLGLGDAAFVGDNETPGSVPPVHLDNDGFDLARVISGRSGSIAGTTLKASGELDEQADTTTSAPIESVWYVWTAPATGTVRFDTCDSAFDTTLAAYTSIPGKAAANDDGCANGSGSAIAFDVIAGQPYRISVDGRAAATGSFTLRWSVSDQGGRMDTGAEHSCAILHDDALRCWGRGSDGRLGYGNTITIGDNELPNTVGPVDLGTGRTAGAVSAGGAHTCAILDNRSVRCWGLASSGQLGYGNAVSREAAATTGEHPAAGGSRRGPTARRSLRVALTRVRSSTPAVSCWGSGGSGQLGYGNTSNRGDGGGEMGDALPVVDLGTGRTAKAIAVGNGHACAILDDGSLKCWGSASSGQLGYTDYFGTTNRGDNAGEMGDNLPAVPVKSGAPIVTAVAAGSEHTCAVIQSVGTKCWGSGGGGRLGYGDTTNRGDDPNEMEDTLPTIDLGTGRVAVGISAGSAHTCAVLNVGAKCWGSSESGRLGYGDLQDRGVSPGQMGDNLPALSLGSGRSAKLVGAGSTYTCALLDDKSVRCWGSGTNGRLGYGNTSTVGDDETPATISPVSLDFDRFASARPIAGVERVGLRVQRQCVVRDG